MDVRLGPTAPMLSKSSMCAPRWRDVFPSQIHTSAEGPTRSSPMKKSYNSDANLKVGDQDMQIELLERKIEILEDGLRPPSRRLSL